MTEFEKMVQKWVVKDYFNPSIKAEVIWDMLLSEFITEIITFGLGDEADEIFLLAKEFPISNEKVVNGKETLSSAKIDYLLLRRPESQKPQIILVELKTSNDSFNEEQLVRYRSYLGGKKTEKFSIPFPWISRKTTDIFNQIPFSLNGTCLMRISC